MHSSAGTLFGIQSTTGSSATPNLSFGSSNTTNNSTLGGTGFSLNSSTSTTLGSSLSFGAKSGGFGSFGASNASTGTSIFGATTTATKTGFGSGSFGVSSSGPTLTSQPVFGSTGSGTATTTQATGFGLNTSFGGTSSIFGGGSKPSGFGFGAGTSTSFGLSATPATAQNNYPHLSVPSNATDLKYQQLYEAAFRASCEKGVNDTTLLRDLPPKLQELCANLEKMQKEAVTKRNALVESMIKTAPCLKVLEGNAFDESVFPIPDQTEDLVSQFRQLKQEVTSDQLTIEKLSTTTTQLLGEVKRLEQLVNKVKATRNSSRSENSNLTSFNRQKTFNRFLPPSLNGNSFVLSNSIPSVHPISKPTDFIEYFLNLEKTQESKIQELNQQLMEIENKTDSFLHEWNQGLLKNKTPEEQFEASLQSAKNQNSILQLKIQESQSRILELRKLAFEAGIELLPKSNPAKEPHPYKKLKESGTPEKDPLDSILFSNLTTPSKPGWDDVLYEIASTELVPSDLSKAKPV